MSDADGPSSSSRVSAAHPVSASLASTLRVTGHPAVACTAVQLHVGGCMLNLPTEARPFVHEGDAAELTIGGASSSGLRIRCNITARAETPAGVVVVDVDFLDLEQLIRRLPPMMVRAMNRRHANRIRLGPTERVDVSLFSGAKSASAPTIVGKLYDVSTGGIGIIFEKDTSLDTLTDEVRARFGLPDLRDVLDLRGVRRGAIAVDGGVKLGVEFDEKATPNFQVHRRVIARFVTNRIAKRGGLVI